MVELAKAIVNWLTFGPLKGFRTQILSALQVALAGLYFTHHLPITPEQYAAIVAVISAASSMTASTHSTPS